MVRRYQRLSPAQADEIWVRLRAGHAAKPTARALGIPTSTVRTYLLRCGGIRPGPRRRAAGRLRFEEREEISRGLAAGRSLRSIAAGLGRSTSTVSREVAAGGGRRRYRAAAADRGAWARATRPKACKLATNPVLAGVVAEKLARRWSPQQIAGWLKLAYPDNPEMHVSHESIYRTLFVQSRGALRRELTAHLRTGRVIRHPRGARLPDGRGGRPGILHISERPAEAADRAVPGHWEGDLVFGKHMSPVATLVERSTRYLLLVSLPAGNHTADVVADALAAAVGHLPAQMARSLTWDQGHEMAAHARFTTATGIQVYFCDPKSPWQRGSNENTNGLLRQYLPRRLDFRTLTQQDLDAIALELNDRPRQTLGYKTPSQVLAEVLR
ncbi:IS30 family transposase, partial [Salmonella enterica subsp. enterica serovar Senftenberg]|nr:IS30 family transposase [Salmonella enterica]EBF6878206.1 IS30 family transposase [Salmonella enterica subsp. enterica serovar Saintpaul]EBM0725441.1 IS30 family transposase [Salmonella enterica subsp. enterica serovar Senftenberg]EGZ4386969.1 IS30 family transposase [Salmonella enterica subsp. enterica serovar Javiana]EAX0536735.1 IS30 family transposase [Salmonella enterica]